MSLRFLFRFEPGADPIEIPYAKLAAEHPELAHLREHMRASARAAEERAGRSGRGDLLGDQAFAGFLARCMHTFGTDYLERVIMRITYVGAAFLAVVAIIPSLISAALEVNPVVASFYGGTGLLIVISVALDLVQKINSHLVMRNYPGLTED